MNQLTEHQLAGLNDILIEEIEQRKLDYEVSQAER